MSKRMVRRIPAHEHDGVKYHVSMDRKVYRLDPHGMRRIKGEAAIPILDDYDRQVAATLAFRETVPPQAQEPEAVFADPADELTRSLAKEAPEWA